jgi:hypothetical protein
MRFSGIIKSLIFSTVSTANANNYWLGLAKGSPSLFFKPESLLRTSFLFTDAPLKRWGIVEDLLGGRYRQTSREGGVAQLVRAQAS